LATASLPVAQVMADWRRDLLPSLLFGVVALAGMTVLGVVAMRRAWAEQAGQVRLVKASQALEHTLDEKDALLAELHHRVKNNMQVIVTLLQMEQARQGDSDTRRRFEALSGRIVLMGRIHERLYASESFARLDLRDHLREHCADQAKAFPKALVTVTGQTVWCGFDTALPLALIVHELVDNALRGVGSAPEIQVQLSQHDGGLTVVVSAKRGDWVGQQDGLGRVLIQALAAQIGAEVAEQGDDGTAVILTLSHEQLG
jgi:two-component sensor histidine kinase